jgi:hypothetical protein
MKYAFAFLACLCSLTILAQKPFEGRIVYQMSGMGMSAGDGNLTLSFIPNHIRIQFESKKPAEEQEQGDKEIIIINLDSGKVFTIKPDDKTYQYKALQRVDKQGSVEHITIAGYKASTVDLSEVSPLGLLSSVMAMGETTVYVSDDLYFMVPDQYRSNAELAMIYKGRILLGARVAIKNPDFGMDTSNKEMKIMATRILPQKLDRQEFLIPAGYTALERGEWSQTDTMVMYDTLAMPDTAFATTTDTAYIGSIEPVAPKSSKTPATKKTPAKSKKGTKSSPARKED